MKRNLKSLNNNTYDVAIVGGGMYGACIAWEAASRGLTVALVEQQDFGWATSANSLKVIHGGLRYLQHLDLRRARRSIGERRSLLQIAPHLVHPMPVLIPTYGHGMKGREVLTAGILLNDVVSFDRNRRLDPQKHLPRGRLLSTKKCLQMAPGIAEKDLTGGVLFHDAQVYNSERLPLAFLHSAVRHGADVANYAEAVGLIRSGQSVQGVTVRDRLSDEEFDVRARCVINAAGPWNSWLHKELGRESSRSAERLATAINLVTRPLFEHVAVGVAGATQYQDRDAVLQKGSRFFFIAPWRDKSMIGTQYIPYSGHPRDFAVTEQQVQDFLDEVNQVLPAARITLQDVAFVQAGLVPIDGVDSGNGSVQLAKHYHIHDHQQDGVSGLLTVTGVKYTTARFVAEQVIDQAVDLQGLRAAPSVSAQTPLHGGEIEGLEAYSKRSAQRWGNRIDAQSLQRLVYNYGTEVDRVLAEADGGPSRKEQVRLGPLDLAAAATRYAIEHEMACTLGDVIFRRTELGTAGHPGDHALEVCAAEMARKFNWSEKRKQHEIAAVIKRFPLHQPARSGGVDRLELAGAAIQ